MPQLYFSYIDFYDAVLLIGGGLVDFDETYPHITKNIKAWEKEWKPVEPAEWVKVEYATLAVHIGDEKYRIYFTIMRPDLLPAVALLINLGKPKSLNDVELVINNLFQPTEFKITQ